MSISSSFEAVRKILFSPNFAQSEGSPFFVALRRSPERCEGSAKGFIRPFGAYAPQRSFGPYGPQRSFGFASGWGGVVPEAFLLRPEAFYFSVTLRPQGRRVSEILRFAQDDPLPRGLELPFLMTLSSLFLSP